MPVDPLLARRSAAVRLGSGIGSAVLCGALALGLNTAAIAQQATGQQTGTAGQQADAPAAAAPAATQDATQAPPADSATQPATVPETAQQTTGQQAAAAAPETGPEGNSPAAQNPLAGAVEPVPGQAATAQTATGEASAAPLPGEISEDDLKKLLVGKPLYLRGGYLDNNLTFNESGALVGHSPQGSYTLNAIEIEKVHLSKHKVELEGARYGLHFLGALPNEDPSNSVDRVRITPKKKMVKITIDREQVLTHKKKNEKEATKGKIPNPAQAGVAVAQAGQAAATTAPGASPVATPVASTETHPTVTPNTGASTQAPAQTEEAKDAQQPSDADQVKAEVAAAPAAERPADPGSVTATYSPKHAAGVLRAALDRVFAPGIDERLIASMPECWQLYYQAAAAKVDYQLKDPTVLRQNAVDKKARLVSAFQPGSNEYAQASAVAGMALYHTVIGADGKPVEIAVGRPIGFGLDENAVDAIRKAAFEPAIKDGKPVAVVLDLVVEFHIYSKRTAATGNAQDAGKTAEQKLPGPYSLLPQ